MKRSQSTRFFQQLNRFQPEAGHGNRHVPFLRRGILLSLLLLMLVFSARSSFADRTVYVMSGSTEQTVSSADQAKTGGRVTPGSILDSMTLEQKIEQMLMPSVRDEDGGGRDLTELTPVAQEAIKKHSFCGYLFFSQNCQGIGQMTRLTASMQRAAVDPDSAIKIPLLLAVDQEGGRIERLHSGTMTPGNMALGAARNEKAAKSVARIIGSEMFSLGFNVDCAPVVDVNSNPKNPVINLRSFGGDAGQVADLSAAFVSGLHQSGVEAMIKHFPGHGDTATDSHTGLPLINKTEAELAEQELIPFQAGIDAGAGMIMTAHIEFPNIEKDTYISKSTRQSISLPATLSDDILTGLLREKMGYDGVIVTDALKMEAIRRHFDLVDAAELAINAGVDIILNPGDITTEAHVASLEQYIRQIAERVENGTISEATIDDAVLRILKLKEKNGLLKKVKKWQRTTDADVDRLVDSAGKTVGSEHNAETARKVAEQSVTLLKNEDQALPVSKEKTVILCPEQAAVTSVRSALNRLQEEGVLESTENVTAISYAGLRSAGAASCVAGAGNVIAVSVSQLPTGIGKGSSAAFLRNAAAAVQKSGGRFILVSGDLPYDVAAFQNADAILVSYGYKSLTEIPKDKAGEEPDYGPNLPAAISAAFGSFTPSGSLPVEIPEMDAYYNYTGNVLYPLGYSLQDWNDEQTAEVRVRQASVPDNSGVKEDKSGTASEDVRNAETSESGESGSRQQGKKPAFPVSPLEGGLAVVVVLKYLLI